MRLAWALLLLPPFVFGCATVQSLQERDKAWSSVTSRYPLGHGFRLQQRVTLLALGKEYPMMAYLAVSPEGRWRMQASSELGGQLFDLMGDTATAQVLRAPQAMGEKPLLQGLARDLRALYLKGPRDCQDLALLGPYGFRLEDRCWHYSLEAHDIKLTPGAPPASAFKAPKEPPKP